MEEKQSKADLLALRGGLRGRFRRVFDGMENAFEVLLDQLEHPLSPADPFRRRRTGCASLRRRSCSARAVWGIRPPMRLQPPCCTAPACRAPSTC